MSINRQHPFELTFLELKMLVLDLDKPLNLAELNKIFRGSIAELFSIFTLDSNSDYID